MSIVQHIEQALLSPKQGHNSDSADRDCKQDNANCRPYWAADVLLGRVVVNILSTALNLSVEHEEGKDITNQSRHLK